jgi:hypothetical protein
MASTGTASLFVGAVASRPDQATVNDEYLTIAEVAARLKIKPKTVKNKMAEA